jgi:hypothetical protein
VSRSVFEVKASPGVLRELTGAVGEVGKWLASWQLVRP